MNISRTEQLRIKEYNLEQRRLQDKRDEDYRKVIEKRKFDEIAAQRTERNIRLDLDKGQHIDLECQELMYKVKGTNVTFDVMTLVEAMNTAKAMNEFVSITGPNFEIVGMFGVDSVKDGLCPDGVVYDWNKASRIGRVKKERV